MRTRLSAADLVRLRGDVKALRRREPSLTQAAAQDQIARHLGRPNWALLQRELAASGPAPGHQALELTVEPFEGRDHGVYFLKIDGADRASQALLQNLGLVFEVPPCPPGWHLRRFTEHSQLASDPYLERDMPSTWIGRFVKGKFLTIASVTGLPDGSLHKVVSMRSSTAWRAESTKRRSTRWSVRLACLWGSLHSIACA